MCVIKRWYVSLFNAKLFTFFMVTEKSEVSKKFRYKIQSMSQTKHTGLIFLSNGWDPCQWLVLIKMLISVLGCN